MADRQLGAARGRLTRRTVLAAVIGAAVLAGGGTQAAEQVRLLETGSTLLYPLFNLWVAAYAGKHPGVQITTQGTGSGTGIAEAISGIAQIGASDAYMSNVQMKKTQRMLNIPLAVSSQMINVNLPELKGTQLKLSGPVLAGIYTGKITTWDDAQLKQLNPGLALPHKAIVPVHRTDGSGDTFIFSQYLSATTPPWAEDVGYGTTISWPALQGGIGAQGNPGMVNALKGTPYSIGYIGVSFRGATQKAGLAEAMLQNKAGKFVLASAQTVAAAVAATAAKTPVDQRISLIFAPGDQSYPIINYEYAIVKQQQSSPETAAALKHFLGWTLNAEGGSSAQFLDQVGFVALPAAIAAQSQRQIASIR